MNRLFNLDNPLWRFLTKFCDLLLLSILWTLCCIPLVTIGSSTAALYYSVHNVIYQDTGYAVSGFWKSFRTNLKQGVLLTLLCIPVLLFILVSYFFADAMGQDSVLGVFYTLVAILLAFLLLSTVLVLFPLLSRFYMKIPDLLKTSVAFAVTRLGFTLILDILTVLCAVTVYTVPISLFLIPGVLALAAERLLEPAFARAAGDKDDSSEPEAAIGESSSEDAGPLQ